MAKTRRLTADQNMKRLNPEPSPWRRPPIPWDPAFTKLLDPKVLQEITILQLDAEKESLNVQIKMINSIRDAIARGSR